MTGLDWRSTGREPRFFVIDPRALCAAPLVMFNLFSQTAWVIFLSTVVFFVCLERFQLKVPIVIRLIRTAIGSFFQRQYTISKMRYWRWRIDRI